MATENSIRSSQGQARLNKVQALDAVDRKILAALAVNARLPNNALADLAGVAPSTCLARVRSLRDRGIIRGFHTEIDPAALGRPIQAMVSVRLQSNARSQIGSFMAMASPLPGVLNVFFVGGPDDFLIQVAADSTQAVRDFVIGLSENPDVALTQTSLIFEHVRSDIVD